jgi:hypothetical protein
VDDDGELAAGPVGDPEATDMDAEVAGADVRDTHARGDLRRDHLEAAAPKPSAKHLRSPLRQPVDSSGAELSIEQEGGFADAHVSADPPTTQATSWPSFLVLRHRWPNTVKMDHSSMRHSGTGHLDRRVCTVNRWI